MIRRTAPTLPIPTPRDLAVEHLTRDVASHDAHAATIPALNLIETEGAGQGAPLALPLTVGAWNLERCLDPDRAAARVADCHLLLLSEMDNGMARTLQRDTPREMAGHLGMSHAFAVEFLELGLGSPEERWFCRDTRNARGFHGNALLARCPLASPFALRLPGRRQWFADPEQPRLGERLALGARIDTREGPFIAVSTHLESACDPEHRGDQILHLIETLDRAFPGLPVLIGGDLNTGNHAGGDWRAEPLFKIAGAAGFTAQGGDETRATTRPSRITRFPTRAMKLDWFLARGLRLGPVEIRPALDADGTPLSDHEALVARIEALETEEAQTK